MLLTVKFEYENIIAHGKDFFNSNRIVSKRSAINGEKQSVDAKVVLKNKPTGLIYGCAFDTDCVIMPL
jgi:hypothetical protein